ncbi:hypothetical protein BLS_006123 [Venturia inaequalis]|uniref:Uncharacterized protein n=1 Tax=Venturia inaequalis TaxID=5025 RepID=A0A8H3YXR7_VENIN|nr:hypothetical protein BLS_006123 [Venturia inaequalis]KAE9977965.1 hypothetical protein EG328_001758 [Venturia inaequalis]
MTQPQQQQQRPPPPPLDALQGIMNGLLALLGSILSDPSRRKDINQRYAIQKLFPDANSRYHDALDKLEDDLAKAKAIMRRDLAALRAEKRKEAEAKEKKAQGLSISPEITKLALPETSPSSTIKLEKQDSAPETKPEEQPAKEPSPAPIPPPTASLPVSPKDKPEPETINPEENDASNAMETFDIDDLFGDPGDNENENENTVNSIDMTDFHSPSHDVPLLPGLESYANMPDTSLPESSGAGIQAGTSSAMENDNGGLDFSMLGIPETSVAENSNAGLGIDGLDGAEHGIMKETGTLQDGNLGNPNEASGLDVSGDVMDGLDVANLTEEEQKKQGQQQGSMEDDFWADLKTGDENTFGDDGGMGDADNSFADLIGFNDDDQLDTGDGGGDDMFSWALDDN